MTLVILEAGWLTAFHYVLTGSIFSSLPLTAGYMCLRVLLLTEAHLGGWLQ